MFIQFVYTIIKISNFDWSIMLAHTVVDSCFIVSAICFRVSAVSFWLFLVFIKSSIPQVVTTTSASFAKLGMLWCFRSINFIPVILAFLFHTQELKLVEFVWKQVLSLTLNCYHILIRKSICEISIISESVSYQSMWETVKLSRQRLMLSFFKTAKIMVFLNV